MKIWTIGGGALGSAFGPVPVALAEPSSLGLPTCALFALWPALALFGTAFGVAVAYLQDQIEAAIPVGGKGSKSSLRPSFHPTSPTDRS